MADISGRDVGTPEECSEAQKAERAKGIIFEDAVPVCYHRPSWSSC